MVRFVLTAVLLMLLVGCGNIGLLPTSELVEKAIALQLEQTQQQLNQQLNIKFQGFKIQHLKIRQEQPLTIENLPAFRVKGDYDLVFQLPQRQLKKLQQPFDLYLQIQKEGKTWRLLLPTKESLNGQTVWRSYVIF
ncbi:hypothetical protein ACQFX9_07240 [Aliinostoc sp. HNIBRCY26]|uniref:hypothetical protein n=1 Tax=Aliinostoc sp. HNIBRCY26 TaxID=3418997 RepID=UPI003D03B63C